MSKNHTTWFMDWPLVVDLTTTLIGNDDSVGLTTFVYIYVEKLTIYTREQYFTHFNDLLDRLSSERDRDKVTKFFVGDTFSIHLASKYVDFQEKIFVNISGRKLQTLGIS